MPKQNPYKKKEYVRTDENATQTQQQPPKTPDFDIDEILRKIKENNSEQEQ